IAHTPYGFSAQVITINGSYYIDPYANGLTNEYISYFRSDYAKARSFLCEVPDDPNFGRNPITEAPCRGNEMRVYRLAVACTGEYAQAPGVAAGTNAAILHAAILKTVNRVVGVYERDITVRLILVANNNLIEYLSASTDPFNGNNNANVLINESQVVIDAGIGHANYDIGHTFSTGGGGLAQLNSPCGTSKARGITGSPQPTGDAYDIDYVAHEMGHQLGGNHTMAGCGAAPNNTRLEPGGGTSIQAYAGICPGQDIHPNSDPFFHSKSFDEISNFLSGFGSSCGVVQPTTNNVPVIDPLPAGVTIPLNTPFTLTGTATDPDGDPLIYSWEQQDFSGTSFTAWNAGATAPAGNTVPLFKMRLPKTTGSRTFPDPAVIAAGFPANPPVVMNGLKGETLSPVARPMTFRLIVRDSRAAGGGVASAGTGGCQSGTAFTITVAGTTPFTMTSPNGGETYPGNSNQTVTWNISGTNVAPFNVANVKISLSTDGGVTFPTVLANSTANDGSEVVNIPNTPTTTARIKVEAVGNLFFDMSNANFTITMAVDGFSFGTTAATTVACPAPVPTNSTLTTAVVGTFTTPITLTQTGVVAGGPVVSFTPATVTPGNSTVVTLTNAAALSNGTYTVNVQGVAGTTTQTTILTFVISSGTAPTITGANQPQSTAVCVGTPANFAVTATGAAATGYQWQLNSGTGFANIAGATTASYTTASTTIAMSTYQYRVIVTGQCGATTSSAAVLTVNAAPAIATAGQPQNTTVCAGNTANFAVTATGAGLTYAWEQSTNSGTSWSAAPGANTAATYSVAAVTLGQSGYQYRVIVSGTCTPAVTSSVATLTVGNEAQITPTGNPASLTVCVGSPVSFAVTATGSSLTYQWQVNTGTSWADVPGATSATLNIPGASVVAGMNGYKYRVNVFSCTTTPVVSTEATLTVNELSVINTQPTASVICAGSNTSFTVAAAGTNIGYQWQVSTTGCTGTFANITNGAVYGGATTATLALTAPTAALTGYAYRVVITNSCNTVTSSCVALTVNSPIAVTTQPVSGSVCLPTSTTSFSVAVTGTAPTYQWQVSTNGGTTWANATGASATTATLSLTGLTAAMSGYQYRVVLSGTCTAAFNSNVATLTVNSPVSITDNPDDAKICEGDNTSFTVAATGSTITYQWQVRKNGGGFLDVTNGAPYAGATTATLSITNATTVLSGSEYRVIVSGVPCGSVFSDTALLTVNANPGVLLVAAQRNNITPSTPSGLYSTVSPAGTYSYVWTRDGNIVSGANASSLPVNVDGFGSYDVTVTDQNGCNTTSNKVAIADSVSNLIFIYPNPSNGVFQVRYYSAGATDFTLNVFDAKGNRVWNKKYPVTARYEQLLVNLGRNASGVYKVELRAANGKRLAAGNVLIKR
ncbi:MAG: T9SS type A sorting domain-containing protein, partial [Sphingobacteriales bacterium]